MRLYDHHRSSASYRVRIALALKGIEAERVPVDLARGDHRRPEYGDVNPQRLVPTLEDGDWTLPQSLAILEYLDETHPDPPLLPGSARERARVRSLALVIACDVHPLNNLRVLRYLESDLATSAQQRQAWYAHWIAEGLGALEALVAGHPETGTFCHGDRPTIADVCLVPQLFNADRFDCDLGPMPTLRRIRAACEQVPAFQAARPAAVDPAAGG